MGEVIVITSGKGGVGKTTTVANIGTGLAMMGKKTVVVDTDIGLRNLDAVSYTHLDVYKRQGGCTVGNYLSAETTSWYRRAGWRGGDSSP